MTHTTLAYVPVPMAECAPWFAARDCGEPIKWHGVFWNVLGFEHIHVVVKS